MDAFAAQKMNGQFRFQRALTVFVIGFVSILLTENEQLATSILFTIMIVVLYMISIQKLSLFNGYGVAHEVNALLGKEVVPEKMSPQNGFTPPSLATSWQKKGALYASALVSGSIGNLIWGHRLAHVTVIASTALLCLLMAEIYLWFSIERKRHWFLHDSVLTRYYVQRRASVAEYTAAAEMLKKHKLLVHGAPLF